MISVSYGAATIYKRAFVGKMPTSARSIRGFSYRANRFPISHDSGTHVGGDQWIVQVQCCPQKADQFARKRGVGDTWWFRLTQFVKAFVQSALGFPGDADNSFKKKSFTHTSPMPSKIVKFLKGALCILCDSSDKQ